VKQFLLPLTFKGCNPQNLSRPNAEGHVPKHIVQSQIANLKSRGLFASSIGSPIGTRGGSSLRHVYAEHQRDDAVFPSVGRVRDPDRDAIAQDRSAIE